MNRLLLTTTLIAPALLGGCGGSDKPKVRSREELLKPETCKECHEDHYREWSGSMHAYAAKDPVFLAMNELGQKQTDGKLGDFCVNCHAPLAVREGATTDGTNLKDVPDHLQGITCYYCHNVASVEGTHNNPLKLANDQTMRGGITDPVKNDAHHSEYSGLIAGQSLDSAKMCGSCHDIVVDKALTGGTNDAHLEQTFVEWKDSLFSDPNSGAQSCALCHMRRVSNVPVADFPGVKSRPARHQHDFPAVDVAFDPLPAEDPQNDAQLTGIRRILDTTMRVQICVSQSGTIGLELENLAAGHSVPSGARQDRRFWAEVRAFDDNGDETYSSGVVGDDEAVLDVAQDDPGLVSGKTLFHDVIFDADGAEAHMFWQAADLDTYEILGAKTTDKTDTANYHREVVYPEYPSAPGNYQRVTVTLHFRPMGFDVLDALSQNEMLSQATRDEVARARSAMPTHALLPNREDTDVTLEWTRDEAYGDQNGYTGEAGGEAARCMQTRPSN